MLNRVLLKVLSVWMVATASTLPSGATVGEETIAGAGTNGCLNRNTPLLFTPTNSP